MYQAGALLAFMLTGIPGSTLLFQHVHHSLKPEMHMEYDSVKGYLIEAFERTIPIIEQYTPKEVQEDVVKLYRAFCTPDLKQRGDTRRKAGATKPSLSEQYSVYRFISIADRIATTLEKGLTRKRR